MTFYSSYWYFLDKKKGFKTLEALKPYALFVIIF